MISKTALYQKISKENSGFKVFGKRFARNKIAGQDIIKHGAASAGGSYRLNINRKSHKNKKSRNKKTKKIFKIIKKIGKKSQKKGYKKSKKKN